MADQAAVLKFVPFSSAIEIGFWHKLTKNKLEKFKLDDSLKNLFGSFVNSKYYFGFFLSSLFPFLIIFRMFVIMVAKGPENPLSLP